VALLLSIFALGAAAQQPGPQPQPAAEEQPVFRGGVTYVRVDAQVLDGKKPIPDLTKDDFQVLDEGAPQTIEYFGRETEPLCILLLLDVYGSMRERVQAMSAVAREALRVLGPQDRVAVMLFGRETKLTQPFTGSYEEASGSILAAGREKSLTAGSSINPALMEAARYTKEQSANRPGRRAILILTDNEGLNHQASDEQTLSALYAGDIVLNAIVTPKAKPPKPWSGGNPDFSPNDVFKLARETGGEVLPADKTGPAFQQMLERIRTRYSLHYRAPETAAAGAPERRRIRVELNAAARKRYPKAEIRARSGY